MKSDSQERKNKKHVLKCTNCIMADPKHSQGDFWYCSLNLFPQQLPIIL